MSNKNIINQSLAYVMAESFGRYAKYIIQDRALPDIRDGLKPVQRRILYAMYQLGLSYDKPYKKSARTVGEVIGKYHPHGDSSIYEAMVRMSQDWKNNLPLLDMHGNNGSIDGDGAAAMRYTECRLAEVASLMLNNIKKETIDFTFNFDDTEKEPTVLPALLPNLLINGGMGIAAGYATNIPTHNSTEVFNALIHRIDNPNSSLESIMKIIPGPDFPTGAIIQGLDGIKEAFKTGKGKFIISSKIDFKEDKKLNQLIISEIPYDTNKSNIIKQINEQVYDDKISGILEVRDESDKNGVQIVIDIKKDAQANAIKNFLLKNTSLQISYATNFVTIKDRKPVLVGLLEVLDTYIFNSINIIIKTAKFDLNKALLRLEIVQGLIKAVSIIDEIIKIIRSSHSKENAKENLVQNFEFTENQAEAIVTLRLYRLTQTDILELRKEWEDLKQSIYDLNQLISSEQIQKTYLKNLLREYREKYGQPRKTTILKQIEKLDIDQTAILDHKDVFLSVSYDGYLKVTSKKTFETNDFEEIGLKPVDNFIYTNIVNTANNLIIITNLAKSLVIPIYKIKNVKWKDLGTHLNDFSTFEPNEKIIFATVLKTIRPNTEFLIFTKLGGVKRTNLEESLNLKQIKISSLLKLKSFDEVHTVLLNTSDDPMFLTILSSNGNAFIFSSAEIPLTSKTAGVVKLMKLKPNETFVGATISKTINNLLLAVANNGFKLLKMQDLPILKRASTGKSIILANNSNPSTFLNLFLVTKKDKINLVLDNENLLLFDLNNLNVTDLQQRITQPFKSKTILSAFKNELFSEIIIENVNTNDTKPFVLSDLETSNNNESQQISGFVNEKETEK